MHMNKHKKNVSQKRGFTLIELLTVIGIIALLVSIGGAGISVALEKGKQAAAGQRASEIAKSYYALALASATKRSSDAQSTNDWAIDVVSWANGDGPNNTALWFVDGAVDASGNDLPPSLAVRSGDKWVANDGWNSASPSYNAVANYLKSGNFSTMPLMWTTGISSNGGTWNADSPFAGKGGHVIYGDARVTWLTDTTDQLVDYDTKASTSSFTDAIKSSDANYKREPRVIEPR